MVTEAKQMPDGSARTDELQYRDFWESNLNKMDEVSSRIEKMLVRLEKKYVDFEESYDELTSSIDLLLSIYGNYNSLQGADYLLKLKACLKEYRRRHTHEGIRFNVLYFLHAKVMELRSGSFGEFPRMKHGYHEETAPPVGRAPFIPTHRWITFSRHGAWFIMPFDTIEIVPRDLATLIPTGPDGQAHLSHNGTDYPVIDSILPREKVGAEEPGWYIIAGGSSYAATSRGRRIMAGRDIFRDKLRDYPHSGGKYIRLFGKNHTWIGG